MQIERVMRIGGILMGRQTEILDRFAHCGEMLAARWRFAAARRGCTSHRTPAGALSRLVQAWKECPQAYASNVIPFTARN
jgi:hypothetical protein